MCLCYNKKITSPNSCYGFIYCVIKRKLSFPTPYITFMDVDALSKRNFYSVPFFGKFNEPTYYCMPCIICLISVA